MQWIILLLITLVLLVLQGLFGKHRKKNYQKHDKRNQKEIFVPRQHRLPMDMEVGNEIRVNPKEIEPEWEIFGFTDTSERTRRKKENQSMVEGQGIGKRLTDFEFAAEVETITLPEKVSHHLRVHKINASADHIIHIGTSPKSLPAHELPINLELSPSLTALVKDPYWAFVYWVLPPNVPEGTWEIRVQNLTDQNEFFERVDPAARRWYLHLNQPNTLFAFELGVRNQHGYFQSVLSSEQIQMPPDRPSNHIDAEWLTINELYQGHSKVLHPQGSATFALELGGASEMMLKDTKH